MTKQFRVSVTKLLHRPELIVDLDLVGSIDDMFVSSARVANDTEISVIGRLEAAHPGILFTGSVKTKMITECRRCLSETSEDLLVEVRELFLEGGDDEESYPFEGEFIDLTEMVRDSIVLALPAAPICRADCKGICQVCGANRNDVDCNHDDDGVDPRFRVLDQLK
ncbi:MAG: DUF177 domain-containing protein [Actinomycetota bacterium]|nr:DUF177 domain-containing protein [Actinomycetota bacterium]